MKLRLLQTILKITVTLIYLSTIAVILLYYYYKGFKNGLAYFYFIFSAFHDRQLRRRLEDCHDVATNRPGK